MYCVYCVYCVCIYYISHLSPFLHPLFSTATENEDFDATSQSRLVFDQINVQPPVTADVEIETFDDDFAEDTESFICALRLTVNPGDPLQSINPDTVTISIIDNDGELRHKCI